MMRKWIFMLGMIVLVSTGNVSGQEKKFYAAPVFSLKTNTLYWLTTTPNADVEVALGKKITFDLSGTYNAWSFGDNKKIKHWLVQPEFRYWESERFNGHFFGIHGLGGKFNAGGIKMLGLDKYRYEGSFYGGGISYGYQWIIGKRLNLEATIGVGYVRFEYDKYEYQVKGKHIKEGTKNYIGPTKVGLSLVYIIK
ncbi:MULTISPECIES: DUF3575 domain-containing protein [Butyricimonas]|uniref:DUF3575 domain-containing protein n=1 Tax=Butyricimonas TaxID=574697 RepID=UPI0009F68CBB|nr:MULTISPECIES: DUF3575 domain-containing protein [Butyricimonas]